GPATSPLDTEGGTRGEAERGAREPLRLREHVLERLGEPVDVALVEHERRQALEHVDSVARDLAQDVVLAEERADYELAEERRLPAVDEAPRPAAAVGLPELDRPREPEPAHVLDDVETLAQRLRPLEQVLAEPRRTTGEVARRELVQRREAGDHRRVVRREGRSVRGRVLERVEDRLVHRAAQQQRPDRDVAARERLRDRDQVRLEPPVLAGEHAAGAAETGLHLVEAEERPVA